jgi:predicted acetyltransferase
MAKDEVTDSAQFEIIPATLDQQPILANLIELYAHDFSEFFDLTLGPDGRYGYKDLPRYWNEPGRFPFLIKVDGQLAGFVLVKKGSEVSGNVTVWDMAEFFIVRGYRRRGAGTRIAHQLWNRFPGTWEVRVMVANISACYFWGHAVSMFVEAALHPIRVEKDGRRWELFSFESKGSTNPD